MALREGCNRFKIQKDKIAHRLINNEVVILHLERGLYFSLNKTATFIWKLIEQGRDLGQMSEAFAKRFECKEAEAIKDVNVLIGDLEKEGLIDKIKK
ncbi:MAG: PqqD family protein [Candidatus Omnitrophica bacterium]|nr:PqqD family protein [Candidatus Omnitrophota bacterium]